MLYERHIDPDFQAIVYPAAVPEIRKLGLAVEHDGLGFGIFDFGVVHD